MKGPDRPRLPMEARRRFWAAVPAGVSVPDTAPSIGLVRDSGWRWFREPGWVIPKFVKLTGRCLSFIERVDIAGVRAEGHGVHEIGRRVRRNPSTISRELRRVDSSRQRRSYRALIAQADADAKAKRPKPTKLATHLRLHREVQARLDLNHSPEQIAPAAASWLRRRPGDACVARDHRTVDLRARPQWAS